jgi:hypothetical protein
MRPTALIAIAVVAIGVGHLFIVTRALLDPAWLYAIVTEAAAETGDPITEWEGELIFVLATLSLVGALAVSCGIGLLRRRNLARLTWIAASAVLTLVYGFAFVLYVRFGVIWCASLAGIVVAVALASLIHLPKRTVQQSFLTG